MFEHNRKVQVSFSLLIALILLTPTYVTLVHAQVTDDFEPDNSFSEYSNITVTGTLQSQSRSIFPAGDNDYIRFYADPGTYRFYTSSSIDTYGYLYNSDLNQLAYDDDSGGNLQFRIVYNISTSGYFSRNQAEFLELIKSSQVSTTKKHMHTNTQMIQKIIP